jgi:hypothetical protein
MRRRPTRQDLAAAEPPTLAADRDPYLEKLAGELEIDLDYLDDAMAAQPTLLYRAGRELARVAQARDARRREHRAAVARIDGQLRRAAREQGVDVTEAAVSVQVGDHADVVRAARALDDAQQRVRAMRQLCGAFRERGRMLAGLVQRRTER